MLKKFSGEQFEKNGYTLNAANEIEGFVFQGLDAEQRYHETGKFDYVNTGGYYHSLPGDPLRTFIDTVAEVQRAMGFENEKDHPEVAPVAVRDQLQLRRGRRGGRPDPALQADLPPGRDAAGDDREFPAQARRRRERQRHAHQRLGEQRRQESCSGTKGGDENLSPMAWQFVDRILTHGNDICLMLNASVNAYRRLDPHFEAPNQIKASAVDRGSMVRIPIGNERSSRVEVRSVGPDANPYMVMLSVFKTGLEGTISDVANLRQADRYLPDNIYDALTNFRDGRMDDDAVRRRRQGTVRRSQAGQRRPLPAPARYVRQSAGSAVPSRSLQSVPLELVLVDRHSRGSREAGRNR